MPLKLLSALLLKLAIQAVLLGVLLPWVFGLNAGATAVAVVVLWLVSFLIGDALVVPAAGAATGALTDLALVGLFLALTLRRLDAAVLEVAAAAALAEYAFHLYLLDRGLFTGGGAL